MEPFIFMTFFRKVHPLRSILLGVLVSCLGVGPCAVASGKPQTASRPQANKKATGGKLPTGSLKKPSKPKARLTSPTKAKGAALPMKPKAAATSVPSITSKPASAAVRTPRLSRQQFRNEVARWVRFLRTNESSPQRILGQIPDGFRLAVARELVEIKKYKLAYDTLAAHKVTLEGDPDRYLDLEHLAGILAICRLRSPSLALSHFQNTSRAATVPASFARAFFWLGQTYRELDQHTNSLHFFNAAARYPTTFYGQLAQVLLQRFAHVRPQIVVPTPTFRCTSFGASPVQERFLASEVQRLFVTSSHLDTARDETVRQALLDYYDQLPDFGSKGTFIASLRAISPHLRVRLYKQFFRDFHTPSAYGYPLLSELFSVATLENFYAMINPAPWLYDWTVTFAHAIILHESEFNPFAVSCVGAQGMMQLMPFTADKERQHLAQGGVITHDTKVDPRLSFGNLMLGSAHLRTLEDRYGPNVFLVAAAYNAGAENVDKWLRINGDPRRKEISMLEWIELIPFRETRFYVQRVAEAFVVYSHLLGTEYLQELMWRLF